MDHLVVDGPPLSSFELDSPRFTLEMGGVFAIIPQLSFDYDENPGESLALLGPSLNPSL
jgi:hypothetical protein